ncbi:MAG TPA: hypothetical protein VGW34_10595 [Allosphingosinicella sp.]|nr:hypothetical protein [Allosphingosinicella sp.]
MIIVPEIETVVILVPRTGTRSLKLAVAAAYPRSMMIYRHMEADGVPLGYDRWRRVGVVRDPVDRLWSLYKFVQIMRGERDGLGKWEPAYVEAQRRSVELPFSDWLTDNQTVFTSPYDSAGMNRFWPGYTVRHPLPETRKSQFLYLRPDLGTRIYRFDELEQLGSALGVDLGHHHKTDGAPPQLSAAAVEHVQRYFAWDLEQSRAPLQSTTLERTP